MELTKEHVEKTKANGKNAILTLISKFDKDNTKINFILDSLGYLPKNFKGDWLFKYVQDDNHKIRMSAIRNIGKLKLNGELPMLYALFETESKTEIKREIISSIGRQRNIETKDFLIQVLKDDDPKIVCQAIRALLVFKSKEEITTELKKLKDHKNEMVQSVIEKEFFSNPKKQSKLHHTQTYDFLKNTIVHGDVRKILKSVPEDSIHLTFTSPPYYNARDYSIYPSYKDYLEFLDNVFKEVHRVTKEGRFFTH